MDEIFATGKVSPQDVSLLLANDLWNVPSEDRGMPKPPVRKWTVASDTVYLREWLLALDVRQAKLSEDTGTNEGYISQLVNREKHQKTPTIRQVQTLAQALEMPWRLLYELPPGNEVPLDRLDHYPPELLQRLARGRRKRA